jgi:hypothetical protein
MVISGAFAYSDARDWCVMDGELDEVTWTWLAYTAFWFDLLFADSIYAVIRMRRSQIIIL